MTGKNKAEEAIKNFVIAYRIDPKDPEMQIMKEEMRELDRDLKAAAAKIELDRRKREKYMAYISCGREKMQQQIFEGALDCWNSVLSIVEDDREALEGKRNSELAINNRLRFEKVQALMGEGEKLFIEKKLFDARTVYKQVLGLDPRNRDARDKVDEIDQRLEEVRFAEQKKQQAEGFYTSAINSLGEYKFERAEEDFKNILDLVKDYKDVKQRLASIPGLKKDYQERMQRERIQRVLRGLEGGMLAYAEGRYDLAISSFELVLQLDPKNELAQKQMLLAKDAKNSEEEEKVDRNSPYFDIVNVLATSGKNLYDAGNYAESRRKWEKILQLFPKNKIALSYNLRCMKENPEEFSRFSREIVEDGKELLKQKSYKSAMSKFEIVKSINPDYPGIDNLLGASKMEYVPKGFERTVSEEELNRRYNLGLNFYRKGGEGNIKKALEEFRWVYGKDPGNTKSLININKIESILRISRGDGGVRRVELSEEDKAKVRQYYFRGITYYSNNDFPRAIQEWRKVLAIDKDHERARNNIRKCLVLLRK